MPRWWRASGFPAARSRAVATSTAAPPPGSSRRVRTAPSRSGTLTGSGWPTWCTPPSCAGDRAAAATARPSVSTSIIDWSASQPVRVVADNSPSSHSSPGTTHRSPSPYTRCGRSTTPPASRTCRSAAARVRLVADAGAVGTSPGRTPRKGPRPYTAAVLTYTIRRTPARTASSTRARVPRSLTASTVSASPPIRVAQCTRTSVPAQVPRREGGSPRSPWTNVTGSAAG
ncbi:putative Sterol-4-alpha-carboxylate 3-dehydrogenase, decarboxylating [Streptomyces afghaniensis 772]|uniref:Putative Sterol-4-alpha-carboxylate 3-dehydrogenase, decarboxylating n=1 Tax=Streptomyces afghaniensis 772 TaxID=1283301 RepID=S4MGR7_9ACTN|nr:putative Sterol-4-alpha-carboxylate 3-dehydrogenase, decarboxylating [Streptomyces afghaniensis 772]